MVVDNLLHTTKGVHNGHLLLCTGGYLLSPHAACFSLLFFRRK